MSNAEQIDKEVRHTLKVLKSVGTKAKLSYERHLHIALTFHDDLIVRKGDAWHQLALRSVEHVDYTKAAQRFAEAKSSIDASRQPLAFARIVRDEAWFLAAHRGEVSQGLELVNKAFVHHEHDLALARSRAAKEKGRRQQLITQTYAWRIEYLATGSHNAASELLRVIEHEGYAFCERDQLNIIKFLIAIPQVGIEERMRLQLRASQLNAINSSLLLLPYRTALRSITLGLSTTRRLNRIIRKE